MPRKPISELTPEEAETQRAYNREAKRKSRAGKPPEKDKRGKRDRNEYQREYYARRKAEKENNKDSS